MDFFVSYSRRDETAVRSVVGDLARARIDVWLDQELGGGDVWWQEILQQIRDCRVFLFAVSDDSLRSRPCQAELAYAESLGIPVLPVQVGLVTNLRTASIYEKQVIDYRERTAESAIALIAAAMSLAAQRRPNPDPLPDPPPVPFAYLSQLGRAVDAGELSPTQQFAILTQLQQYLRDELDPSVRDDIVEVLHRLRRRTDITYRNATDLDELLRRLEHESPLSVTRIGRNQQQAGSQTAQPPSATPDAGQAEPTKRRQAYASFTAGLGAITSLLALILGESFVPIYILTQLVLVIGIIMLILSGSIRSAEARRSGDGAALEQRHWGLATASVGLAGLGAAGMAFLQGPLIGPFADRAGLIILLAVGIAGYLSRGWAIFDTLPLWRQVVVALVAAFVAPALFFAAVWVLIPH
jgi:hypothetical protein